MNKREAIVKDYIKRNNLPNAQIIEYTDEKYFDYYYYDQIPQGLALAESVFFDEAGRLKYGFLKDNDGEEHRIIIGATGTGKSMRYLLQQLMVAIKAGQSAIVTDISGQNIDYAYEVLKEEGVNVLLLDFSDCKSSHTYNPFYKYALEVRNLGYVTDDVAKFCTLMANKLASLKSDKEPTWTVGGKAIIEGCILFMYEAVADGMMEPEDVTLYNFIEQYLWLRDKVCGSSSMVKLHDIEVYKKKPKDSKSIQKLAAYIENAERTRAGYFGVVNDNIADINNAYLYNLTSSNTIDLSDLWDRQTVLFINTGGDEFGNFLVGLLVSQLYEEASEFSKNKIDKKLTRPIQLFLDEFANVSFGDPNKFINMLTTTRKMQMFFNLFIQSETQLNVKYNENITTTIKDNCSTVFLGTLNYKSREDFSRICGRKSYESIDSMYYGGEPRVISGPLLTPEQLNKMPKGQMYTLHNRYDVIRTYFEAAYKCDLFKPSRNYKNLIKNEFDYKLHRVLQSDMVKKYKPSEITKDVLMDIFTDTELKLLLCFYDDTELVIDYNVDKFVKIGVLRKISSTRYIPTISKAIVKRASEGKKKFTFDF